MNEELLKVREVIGYDDDSKDYRRLTEEELTDYIIKLNTNMTKLNNIANKEEFDINEPINVIIENIYTILKMFSDMNVFPGYFFRKVFDMNAKYYERKRDYDNGDNSVRYDIGIRGDYRFFQGTNLSAWVSSEIRKGLNNNYHHVEAYPKTNISDAFTEILALFQKYDFPYRISSKEECKKVFSDISVNYSNISSLLANSDSDYEDIEYMGRLLYEYITFFVAIGINPKKYLDEYIENQKEKHK